MGKGGRREEERKRNSPVPNKGARKTEQKKRLPIVTAVSPVLPPSLMPAAVSTWTMTGVEPREGGRKGGRKGGRGLGETHEVGGEGEIAYLSEPLQVTL